MSTTPSYSMDAAEVASAGYYGRDPVTGRYVYSTGSGPDGIRLIVSNLEPTDTQLSAWKSVHPGMDPDSSYYDLNTGSITYNRLPPSPAVNASSSTAADAVNQTPAPSTQNTGTDTSIAAAPVTVNEKTAISESTKAPADTATPAKSTAVNSDDAKPTAAPSNTGTAPKITIRDNILHQYSTYTYGLSLSLLTKDDFNSLAVDPKKDIKPINLISTASRFKDQRDAAFKDDFYFEDFKLTTIIGMNAQSKSTNAIEMSFTVIEPYGLTLLDRILDINASAAGATNYLSMPYLLQLDFYGADDSGKMTNLTKIRKTFPIQILGMKIKASVKGSEYTINCVPFNHQANFQSMQAVKANFEVEGKSLAEFFKSDGLNDASQKMIDSKADSVRAEASAAAQNAAQESNGVRTATAGTAPAATDTKLNAAPNPGIVTRSFIAAYNAWNIAVQKRGIIKVADSISVKFYDLDGKTAGSGPLAEATIVSEGKADPQRSPSAANKKAPAADTGNNPSTQAVTPANGWDPTKQIFAISAGDAVNAIIERMVVSSSFILNQVKDSASDVTSAEALQEANKDKNTELYWFKIIPSVTLRDYDSLRNCWGKDVTFHVLPYKITNTKDSRLATTPIPDPVKDYQFMYTGKNKDVIEFDMNFDALYYTAVSVNRYNTEATSQAKEADETRGDAKPPTLETNTITPTQTQPVPAAAADSVNGASADGKKQAANSVATGIYSAQGGDMLNVKLKILGDPDYIKQDDLLFNPLSSGFDNTAQYVGGEYGSLAMDGGEIYCRLTFNTPVDIDETTGLLRKDSKYYNSKFSGKYRILKVESEFSHGKFLQNLDMIRIPNQKDDSPKTNSTAPDSVKQRQDAVSGINGTANPTVSGNKIDNQQLSANTSVLSTNIRSVTSDDSPGTETAKSAPQDQAPKIDSALVVAANGPTRSIDQGNTDGTPIVAPPTV